MQIEVENTQWKSITYVVDREIEVHRQNAFFLSLRDTESKKSERGISKLVE